MMFLLAALLTAPALAADPAHPPAAHGAHDGHNHGPAEASHGGEAHGANGGDAHGAEGGHGDGHHVLYTADDDHDGTANWLDGDSSAYMVEKLVKHGLNFAILVGLFVAYAWRPLTDSLRARALRIRQALEGSAAARDAAAAKAAEAEARLTRIETEVEAIRARAAAEAETEAKKLVARAHDEARRIGEAAERSIRDEATRARLALRREAVDLAVKLAEGVLSGQVGREDNEKLARDLLTTLKDAR